MRGAVACVTLLAAFAAAPLSQAAVAPVRWCGGDRAATDRRPDRAGGPQVHVAYVVPADGSDRFAELASPLATDVSAIDGWWRREDPTRAPRFDLSDFPGCDTRFGLLDLSAVRLVRASAELASFEERHQRLAVELSASQTGFGEIAKKYLVFYDGEVEADGVCGSASGAPQIGGNTSYAFVYLRSNCGAPIGDGTGNALVAGHELVHMLGALPPGAPHACPGDDGHPCDSSLDLLWPFLGLDALDQAMLDVNRDDYYAHQGTWFDVQDSQWLLDPGAQFPLTVRVAGSGVVESITDGQECSAVCVTEWNGGTAVQLVAQAGAGFRFTGWSGPCPTRRDPACLIQLGAATEVVATFARVVRLSIGIGGRGVVSGGGIRCSRSCTVERVAGETLVLRAQAARGWRFVRWSGACRGSRLSCTVRPTRSIGVRAVFARR